MASTRTYGGNGTPVDEQSLGELVATATRDMSLLIHKEVELAKTELAQQATQGRDRRRPARRRRRSSGCSRSILRVVRAAHSGSPTALNIPVWAGFLCMAGVYLLLAGLLGRARRRPDEERRPAGAHPAHGQGKPRLGQAPEAGRRPQTPTRRARDVRRLHACLDDRPLIEESAVLVDGPWTHRDVNANGIRLHVAEAGTGPLVLLLHGFPEFWWSWRHQLVALADAGYHAVAPDLRGYGASDKPPRGYDAPTLAADVAGIVRALGERDAVIVGHDWGGHLAWSVAALHPTVVRRLVGAVDPAPAALVPGAACATASSATRAATSSGSSCRGRRNAGSSRTTPRTSAALLHGWGGPGFPDAETERRCREAMQILYAPTARWSTTAGRSARPPRTDGRRYRARDDGADHRADACSCTARSTAACCRGPRRGPGSTSPADYEWRLLDGVGHFPHQEAPDLVTGELLRWCKDDEPAGRRPRPRRGRPAATPGA